MNTLADALAPKSDQLNADDLIAGPRTLKITAARIVKDDRQVKVVLNYEGDQGKPFKPCKTMARAMVMVWAITDEAQMVGKSIRVYRDPDVKFGAEGAVGGIRISHMSHIDKPAAMKLTVSQGKKAMHTFNPLPTEAPALTIDDARAAMTEAADLDALKAVWTGKAMAPFRTDLTPLLNERKATLAPGRTDEQHGDQHSGDERQGGGE